jgi:hypothetical protein
MLETKSSKPVPKLVSKTLEAEPNPANPVLPTLVENPLLKPLLKAVPASCDGALLADKKKV